MLLDFKLADSYPNKILTMQRAQNVQFVEKSQVYVLLKQSTAAKTIDHSNACEAESRAGSSVTKRSLFDQRLRTPKMSIRE